MDKIDLNGMPEFARHVKAMENYDRMELGELAPLFAKLGPRMQEDMGAEKIAGLKADFEKLFVSRAFIASDDLKWIIPSMMHDVMEHEGVDSDLEVPDLEVNGVAFAAPEVCARIILDSAKKDGRGRDILIAAYRAFYPKEYRILKKYRTLTFGDMVTLTDLGGGRYDLLAMVRYIVLAPLMGIGLAADIVCAYVAVSGYDEDGFGKRFGTPEPNHNYVPGSRPQLDDEAFRMSYVEDTGSAHDEIFEYATLALGLFGFPEFYIEHAFEGMEISMDGRAPEFYGYARNAYRILYNSENEITPENVGRLAAILHIVQTFCWAIKKEYADFLQGIGVLTHDSVLDSRYRVPPERKGGEPGEVLKPASAIADMMKEDRTQLLETLTDLKQRLRASRDSEKELHRQNEALKAEIAELRKENALSLEQKAELIALREYAFSLKNEDVAETEADDIGDMTAVLAMKKIIVVGGNPVWVTKMKGIFPSWVFIDPNASGSTSVSLSGADMAYFFTDTLSHRAYNSFLSRFKENRLRFSYLHGVNIDQTIRRIYAEAVDDRRVK